MKYLLTRTGAKVFSLTKSATNPPHLYLTPTGNGTGVARINMRVSSNITAVLTGDAHFYTDAAGTIGESQRWDMSATGGYINRYLRCTGSAQMYFNDITKVIRWGDVSIDGMTSPANGASVSFDIAIFTNLQSISGIYLNTIYGQLHSLTSLIDVGMSDNTTISCNLSALNPAITRIALTNNLSNINVYGAITALVNLVTLFIGKYTATPVGVITGDCTNLVHLREFYVVDNGNTITGDVTGMTDMRFLEVRPYSGVTDNNSMYGSISGMTLMYNYWLNGTGNSVGGSLSALNLITHFCSNSTTAVFTGDIAGMTSLVTFNVVGANHTFAGDIAVISSHLVNFVAMSNRMVTYTGGAAWGAAQVGQYIIINPSAGYGLSTAEVDNILIDMAASAGFDASAVTLQGANEARSAASNAAVAILVGRGCTVTTNP